MKPTVAIMLGMLAATAGRAEVVTLKTGKTLTGEVSRVGKSIVEVRSGKSTSYHSLSDLKPDDAKRIAPDFNPAGGAKPVQRRTPSRAARQETDRPAAPEKPDAPAAGKSATLHQVCAAGNVKLAASLIDKGADIAAVDAKGNQPLHAAAAAGQADVVHLLLEKGANVHAVGDYDRMPLHLAVRAGSVEVAEILLAAGADINARSYENEAPLHLAAEGGHAEMIRFLLERDAYPGILSRGNGTALHYAAATGSLSAVEALIGAGLDVNAQDISGRTPLHYAAEQNAADVAALLLDKGAKHNLYGRGYGIHSDAWIQRTPMHVAARFSHPAIVRLLLENGADPHAPDSDGSTPLHEAAAAVTAVYAGRQDEKTEVVRMLAAVCDVNAANDAGETPLICLAQKRAPHPEKSAEILIQRGADVNVEDRTGRTALHYAVAEGYAALVSRLTASGANQAIRDFDGRLPSDLNPAKKPGKPARAPGLDEPTLLEAARKHDLHLVQHLIARGADVNEQDEAGNTPLHRAIWGDGINRDDIERLLLEGGADPKKTNAAGRTPLHTAMAVLSVLKVEALIAGGAPVNAQDRNGDTALHLAAAYGKWDLAAVLLKAKADPNIRNREGSTPLHLASAGRKPEKGIPLLLQHGADPRIMNARGLTPPALARAKGVKDAVAAWEKAGVAP